MSAKQKHQKTHRKKSLSENHRYQGKDRETGKGKSQAPEPDTNPGPEFSPSSAPRKRDTTALTTSKLIPTFAPGSLRDPTSEYLVMHRTTPSDCSHYPSSPTPSPFIPLGVWGSASTSARRLRLSVDLGRIGSKWRCPDKK